MVELNSELERIAGESRYVDLSSMRFLRNLVKGINPDQVLELGTYLGGSALYMASAIKEGGMVFSIDNNGLLRSEEKAMDTPTQNALACGLAGKVQFISGDTQQVSDLIMIQPEVVFMDAHHEPENMWKEYQSFVSLLPERHIIVVDDLWPLVCEFMFELSKQYSFSLIMKDFHQGVGVLFTHSDYLIKVVNAVEVIND